MRAQTTEDREDPSVLLYLAHLKASQGLRGGLWESLLRNALQMALAIGTWINIIFHC